MQDLIDRVRVNRANRNPCPADWVLDSCKTGWRDFALWLIRQGSGTVESPSGRIVFRGGGCIIFRPGTHYIARGNPEDQPVLAISVHFDYLRPGGGVFIPKPGLLPPLHRQAGSLVFLWETLERCVRAWRRPDPFCRPEAERWFRAALTEIDNQDRLPMQSPLEERQSEQVERICANIAQAPGAPHTVERLARQFHASRFHFSRVFKRLKGITPQDFIVNTRVEAAKALLHGSSHPVRVIAEQLGYSDAYFFCRQFRQKTGLTPSAYRRQ